MMEGWKGGRGVTQKSPNQSNKKMHLQCNFTKEEKREKQITVNDLYSIVVYLKLKCVIMLKQVTCICASSLSKSLGSTPLLYRGAE